VNQGPGGDVAHLAAGWSGLASRLTGQKELGKAKGGIEYGRSMMNCEIFSFASYCLLCIEARLPCISFQVWRMGSLSYPIAGIIFNLDASQPHGNFTWDNHDDCTYRIELFHHVGAITYL
jgi:hypothetical protein